MKIENFENIVKVSLTDNIFLAGKSDEKYQLIAKILEQNKFIKIERIELNVSLPDPPPIDKQTFLWQVRDNEPNYFLVLSFTNVKVVLAYHSNACYIHTSEYEAIGMMLYAQTEITEEWIK